MSETVNTEGINISINNSDSNSGGGSIIDRLFDIGLKLLIPLGIVLALVLIGAILFVVPKIIEIFEQISGLGLDVFTPLLFPIGGLGAVFGWLTGR